ncbi:hypothetical protein [Barrientosiimonas endolithica]|nr:hypothetical protein [Barrientosiimonas endolithica]
MVEAQNVRTGPRRRTLVKGAAWAAPAIMVGQMAPASASSGGGLTFEFGGACKQPGGSCDGYRKGYAFTFEVCNRSNQDIYIYTVTYTTDGTKLQLTNYAPRLPYLVKANTCVDVEFRAESSNSANQDFYLNMRVTWGHTEEQGSDPTPHQPIDTRVFIPTTGPQECCPTTTPAKSSTSSSSSSTTESPTSSDAPAPSSTSAAKESARESDSAPAADEPAPAQTPAPAATPADAAPAPVATPSAAAE